ncbi:MAG: SGNH/GDSL hydrolase family protein, partial [Aurantibacter sp.]
EPIPDLKIEFYGNSITSGHGVLDESRNNNDDRALWDNYESSAAVTARALNADYRCISMSGIGLLVSWFPLTMPELYNRLDPNDGSSIWDFEQWQADVVVVNLFQNDSWLIFDLPEAERTEEAIVGAYLDFIQLLRTNYPEALLVCTVGNMDASNSDAPWQGYIDAAVSRAQSEFDDTRVYSVSLPYKNTGAHPTVSEQQQMSDILIPFIQSVL